MRRQVTVAGVQVYDLLRLCADTHAARKSQQINSKNIFLSVPSPINARAVYSSSAEENQK
jgi:hypothetical protein